MATVSQPGLFNFQGLTSLGGLGAGMRLYTYVQGTTTHKTAYTNAAGTIAHTYSLDSEDGQYIALDARGELPAPLYLTSGAYDLCLKTSAGATVWTRRAESESADTTVFTQSGTGATERTVQAKLRDTVSVLDFGVVGDGSDESTEMQAALDAVGSNGRLSLCGLTVTIGSALSVSSKTDFVIDGEGGTIYAQDGMAVSSGKGLLYLTSCSRFRVENITFDANRANRTPAEVAAHTVTLENCKRFIFENVHSNNAVVDGFYFTSTTNTDTSTYCQYFQMIGCYANNCYRQGASVINAYDFQFIGGAYTGTTGTAPQAGIDVESNTGATVGNTRGAFIGVTFSGNAGFGLQLSNVAGSKVFVVDGCNFDTNSSGAIGVYTDQTTVRNCYFASHSGAGVTQGVVTFASSSTTDSGTIENCSFESNTNTTASIYTHSTTNGIRIRGNRIQGSSGIGIQVAGTNHSILDNVIVSCSGQGINSACTDALIQGNLVDSCVGRGIYDAGTRTRILNNTVADISSVSGAYIQAAGSDPLIVGNICKATGSTAVYGVRVDSTALAVHSNFCVNLDTTDAYNFITSSADELFYNNVGGTANDRRRIRAGMGFPSYTTGTRPTASSVAAGTTIFNTTTNKLNTSDGSANWYLADGTVA